jgi:hypothetical protein
MCLYCSYCSLLSFSFFPGWRSVCPGHQPLFVKGFFKILSHELSGFEP